MSPEAYGEPGGLPERGRLRQWSSESLDGRWIETTLHTFSGLKPYNYSKVECTLNPLQTCIRPDRAYEHDYRINTGYVTSSGNFTIESNLPGYYKDTDFGDSGDSVTLTVGASHTWLFSQQKNYHIRTEVQEAVTGQATSTALLFGENIPNDGFCHVPVDSNNNPIKDEPLSPWCFNLSAALNDLPLIGDVVNNGRTAHAFYISKTGFNISWQGSCRDYIYNRGADTQTCGFMTADAAREKLVGETAYVWGKVDANQPVRVWTEFLVNGAWSRSQERLSNPDGTYTIPLTYGSNLPGKNVFRVLAQHPNGEIEELRNRLEQVRKEVPVTTKTATSAPIGRLANVWGTVRGITQPVDVWTEVRVNGSWSTSQRGTTKSDGSYVLPLTYGLNTVGKLEWRVGALVDNTRIYSQPFVFERTHKLPVVSWPAGANEPGSPARVLSIDSDREFDRVIVERSYQGGAWTVFNDWTTDGATTGASLGMPAADAASGYAFRAKVHHVDGTWLTSLPVSA